MGFVVIKFSVHLFIMVFKWLVSRQIRYMPGCELFVFLACIQMYKNLWYFMVHILNDFCLNFKQVMVLTILWTVMMFITQTINLLHFRSLKNICRVKMFTQGQCNALNLILCILKLCIQSAIFLFFQMYFYQANGGTWTS